jgi:hypothetical protein
MKFKNENEQAIPVSNLKRGAHSIAELVLWVLDKTEYRGGKTVQFRDPFSDGLVRIHRDTGGRVHFRTPRVLEASIRLQPNRSKSLLLARNIRPLEDFLDRNPLVLAFLNETKLRGG